MGKNKLKKFSDMSNWQHVFEYAGYDENTFKNPMKGNWGRSFFGNDNPIVLELGCGKGEYSVSLAELYPEKNFIGVDIKGARMWTGAKSAVEKELKNVAFLRTHIEFIEKFFAPGEISEIWLTFPDPQMKKTSRRLTSTRFLEDYRRILIPDGIIHLKTDSNFMYSYTKELVTLNSLPVLTMTDDLYGCGLVDNILSIQTFYEKQWLQRGIKIKYISFRLPKDIILKEPEVEIEPDSYRSFGRSARNIIDNIEVNKQ